jgi:hypothetical protein
MTTTTNKEGRLENFLEDDDFLGRWVTWALWALAIIVCIATVTGLVESFDGLYIWFSTHGITGFWADFAPLMVDSFTVIGELAIFAGISRHWDWKSRVVPWLSAFIGIASSVAGNVGDKIGHPISWELTAAIPPLAGAFGIVIGLGVLKRVAKDHAAKKARKGTGLLPEPDAIAAQLMKDNQELAQALQEARSASVLNVSPAENHVFEGGTVGWEPVAGPDIKTMERISAELADKEQRGLDVLIPPRPPVESPSPWAGIVQPGTRTTPGVSAVDPVDISREEARRRLTDLRPGRPLIVQTGEFAAIPDA